MLLKCTADGRPIKVNGVPVSHGSGARGMKMTMSTAPTMSARVHRKVMRAPHKRTHPGKTQHPGKMVHAAGKIAHHPGKLAHLGKFGKLTHYAHTHSLRPPELCENSNDSGLGPDAVNRLSDTLEEWEHPEWKRRRGDSEGAVKHECEDANDAYAFAPPAAQTATAPADASASAYAPGPSFAVMRAGCSLSSPSITETPGKRFQEPFRSCGKLGGKLATKYPGGGKLVGVGGKLGGKLAGKYGGKVAQTMARRRALAAMHTGRPGLAAPLSGRSRDGTVELQILCQPETQHRARYQTEGSRGAVKDNSGNGFPTVKLIGYDKPAVLQVYIGTDTGRVAPHMFYQACRVSGKNSTPCKELKEDGTVIIEIDLEPAKNWQVTCDCVGILKERNVDVEHRFGDSAGGASRGKKKSTRCRMVFRTDIINAAGQPETLQVCSTQIICTQPPGVPEVCRKSLVSCPAEGGLELYLLGKNFLKETKVVFCHRLDGLTQWEKEVTPDKEFLQQTHLVCCVPPYDRGALSEALCVQLFVRSGGKASEPHAFYYTPPAPHAAPLHASRYTQGEARGLLWGAMLPPRRPSALPDHEPTLKSELADDSSQHSMAEGEPTSDEPDKPLVSDQLDIVDLRLKTEMSLDSQAQMGYPGGYEGIKLSPPTPTPSEPPSPMENFTQQLQAIQTQVQTDKMVETVTAAIFNSEEGAPQMYPSMLQAHSSMHRLLSSKVEAMESDMKALQPQLMLGAACERRLEERFDPFRAPTMTLDGTSHMESLLPDAMLPGAMGPGAMLPEAMLPDAKLDALVNARADDHLAPGPSHHLGSPAGPERPALLPAPSDELILLPDQVPLASVKTPPAAVKSMILNAAAEILTSDSAMNALVTSAINTANILTTESEAPPASPPPAPLAAMSQAVSQAVTQAVSQAVSHAVSQAVSQEMTAPVTGLTDMSDQDLLSYINTSTFDQV